MDEIIPNLWLGCFPSVKRLRINANQIQSILSVMKPKFNTGDSTFIHHQIPLDDRDDEDALVHFIPAIMFIQGELDQGRRVLVHCQAGISRSPTIVAAYLMYTRKIDRDAALALIRRARPGIQPNMGFMTQLETFHQAGFKVSRENKATRNFYVKRTVRKVMNGAGPQPDVNMLAENPSTLASPAPGGSSRCIRCKMCRQELATREHLAYHNNPDETVDVPPPESCSPSESHPAVPQPSGSYPTHDNSSSSLQSSGDDSETLSASPSTTSKNTRGPVDSKSPLNDEPQCITSNISPGADLSPSRSIPNVHSSTGVPTLGQPEHPMALAPANLSISKSTTTSLPARLPMLANPQCSGYFLEPMAWMKPFLKQGHLDGKIVCPNKRCGAKLGNYDWVGVRCGCKEWITPGFCISRSKVDEVDSVRSAIV